MSRKNALLPYPIIYNQSMVSSLTSTPTHVQWLDNIAIQLIWDSTAEGTFDVQVSSDYVPDDAQRHSPPNAGTWDSLPLNPAITATGEADSGTIDINQLASPWIRLVFNSTFVESGSITTVADEDTSLNDTYFFLTDFEGNQYYVWYNVDSGGTDPMVPDMTGVAVAISEDDNADTVATATGTAMASITGIGNIIVASNVITFDQDEAGHGALEDSEDAPTGFTFDYTEPEGNLTALISAKML